MYCRGLETVLGGFCNNVWMIVKEWNVFGKELFSKNLRRKLHAFATVCEKFNGKYIFYNKGSLRYEGIMLAGTMEVLQDDETKKDIWCTGDMMFYKQGFTTPDYCVLNFTAINGRHYCELKAESFQMEDLE